MIIGPILFLKLHRRIEYRLQFLDGQFNSYVSSKVLKRVLIIVRAGVAKIP